MGKDIFKVIKKKRLKQKPNLKNIKTFMDIYDIITFLQKILRKMFM